MILNSNMRKISSHQIISVRILYNGDFDNGEKHGFEKTYLKFNNMFKAT